MKKTLLIVIDALASAVMLPAMREGKLPTFRAFAERGILRPTCTSIFPSITHAATPSLVTGHYPAQHGIPGSHWYDPDIEEVIYYSSDFSVVLQEGLGRFFEDFLIKYNHHRLRSEETLFETVERAGLEAACLNYLIFRGDVAHRVNVPFLLGLIPQIPFSEEICGPQILYLGDFVNTEIKKNHPLEGKGGPVQRFGFTDDNTASLLLQLGEEKALSDFTLAYFPDNDLQSHQLGPERAIPTLERLDMYFKDIAEYYGGIESFLEEFCLIVTGDHSQSDILDDKEEASIKLHELLDSFSIAEAGRPWQKGEDLKVCFNLRTANMYFRDLESDKQVQKLITQLLMDNRIDQVIWSDKAEEKYHIATSERGRLHFWVGNDGDHSALDRYGNCWSWQGNLDAVDGHITETEQIDFPTYPNAFERLKGGLDCKNSGDLWLTARLGYEFKLPSTTVHAGGGSHGSLHAADSTAPLLVAGLSEGIKVPSQPRITDVYSLCLASLGLNDQNNHA